LTTFGKYIQPPEERNIVPVTKGEGNPKFPLVYCENPNNTPLTMFSLVVHAPYYDMSVSVLRAGFLSSINARQMYKELMMMMAKTE